MFAEGGSAGGDLVFGDDQVAALAERLIVGRAHAAHGEVHAVQGGLPVDNIGRLSIELKNYRERHPAKWIEEQIRQKTANVPGVHVEVRPPQEGPPTGKDVMIDGTNFRVVGVVEKPKGGFGMGDEDRRVLIPFNTFKKIYPAADELNMRIQAYPGQLDQMVDEATEILRRRRNVPYNGKNNFSIATPAQEVEEFHNIMTMVYLGTMVLSAIGLLIGGVGVMNIMLVSVTERTREIGVRKAIGAKRKDITWQFLLEAMTLTGVGGILALVFVNALVLLIRATLKWHGVVPIWAAALGITVSVSIGLIFGVWPAMKAAKLDPVEALRYE